VRKPSTTAQQTEVKSKSQQNPSFLKTTVNHNKQQQREEGESQWDVGAGGTYDPESWNKSLENAVSRKHNSKLPPQEVIEEGGVFPVKALTQLWK